MEGQSTLELLEKYRKVADKVEELLATQVNVLEETELYKSVIAYPEKRNGILPFTVKVFYRNDQLPQKVNLLIAAIIYFEGKVADSLTEATIEEAGLLAPAVFDSLIDVITNNGKLREATKEIIREYGQFESRGAGQQAGTQFVNEMIISYAKGITIPESAFKPLVPEISILRFIKEMIEKDIVKLPEDKQYYLDKVESIKKEFNEVVYGLCQYPNREKTLDAAIKLENILIKKSGCLSRLTFGLLGGGR
jgi:hypothetical protein